MAAEAKTYRFTAQVERSAGIYAVAIPERVSHDIGKRGSVPVIATVRGPGGVAEVRASLVPTGGGRHRLGLNAAARTAAGALVGTSVRVALRVDRAPRADSLPIDLARALEEAGVKEDFSKMPVGRQNHILAWVEAAVREETRAKRVAKTVEVACAWREGVKGWW
jgi:hypothetical protein